ncbi:YkgJ family cysteine cluster protein [Leucothrix arctica]|uniref:Zinc/iron-chelating domain-containing protein n=1 Tax=Leucothrix arctica TaxID=1481894 RepID=A0A317C7K4_9GAMM|nr:hypothetical protein DKT75_16075 [Leucothrix arctica]
MSSKLIRTITSILPVQKDRIGECNGCGACCHLPVRCTFLTEDESGLSRCSIYKIRPPNCRKFPRTPSQLKLVENECSYSFSTISPDNIGKAIPRN